MERGAVRAASGGARVVGMDELKQARERRAALARGVNTEETVQFRDQYEEWRGEQDERPFWERDDPFCSDGFTPRWRDGGQENTDNPGHRVRFEQTVDEERPMRNNGRTQSRRDAGMPRDRQEPRALDPEERRRPADGAGRRKSTDRDGRSGGSHARQKPIENREPKSRAGLLMLMLLMGLLALAVFIGMKVFEITAIEIKGNDTMAAGDVIKLAGIVKGENIFRVNLGQARKNLESDPLVEVLGISRIFPDKIKIEIRQRQPHGAIAYMGNYVIIDENGVVLDERSDLPAGQYPLVTGIDIKPAQKGKPVTGLEKTMMQTMKKLLTALYNNKAITFVSEVDMSDPSVIRMLTAEGLRIDAGKPMDLDKKAQWIACSVPELRNKGYTSGVLYVSGNADPVYSMSGAGGQTQQ